jgi:FkbM family methyltransferase
MPDIWQHWQTIQAAAWAEDRRPLVIEVGVCDGSDSLRFLASQAEWMGFEPHPVSAELCRTSRNLPVIEAAVSDQDGEADFFLSSGNTPGFVNREHRDSSSLQAPTAHRAWYPWCQFESTARVRTVRLDSIVPPDRVIDLIWADVQGAQRKVIAGAAETLKRTRYLFIECHPQPLYEGETTFEELCDFLPGWSVVEYWGTDVLYRNDALERARVSSSTVQPGISERGFWIGDLRHAHCFDAALTDELARLFAGKTVVDFGCGPGDYVRFLTERGISIEGYDGNPETPSFNPACKVLDLSGPIDVGLFDWVLSLEVGEHIPPRHELTFLANLDRHNRVGIVLSWATVGQGGYGHFNERNNAYVKCRLQKLGYQCDQEAETRLRQASTLPWFQHTIMVFRKQTTVACSLGREAPLPRVSCLYPTYNRVPHDLSLVEEMVESFLRQDYANKELILLNDTPGQVLRFEHPEVRIVNLPSRCASLAQKRDLLADLASGELICVWEENSISLPWRLSRSVEMLGEADYYNPGANWVLMKDGLHHDFPSGHGYFASIYRKRAYQELGGIPDISLGEDAVMDMRLRTGKVAVRPPLPLHEWSYIYRWGVSPVPRGTVPGDTSWAALGRLPIAEGEFVLHPHWEQDYTGLTRAYAFAVAVNG